MKTTRLATLAAVIVLAAALHGQAEDVHAIYTTNLQASAVAEVGIEGTLPDLSPHTEPAMFLLEVTFHFDTAGEAGSVVIEKRRRGKWITVYTQAFGGSKDIVWVAPRDVILNTDELRITNPSGSQVLYCSLIVGK